MAASDVELLCLLIARPTLTFEEAARIVAARRRNERPLSPATERPVRIQASGVVARVMARHATPPDIWSH